MGRPCGSQKFRPQFKYYTDQFLGVSFSLLFVCLLFLPVQPFKLYHTKINKNTHYTYTLYVQIILTQECQQVLENVYFSTLTESPYLGWTRTHGTLLSRQSALPLSYQGSSAGLKVQQNGTPTTTNSATHTKPNGHIITVTLKFSAVTSASTHTTSKTSKFKFARTERHNLAQAVSAVQRSMYSCTALYVHIYLHWQVL